MNQEIRQMERSVVEANREKDKLKKAHEERLKKESELSSEMNERSGELEQLRENFETKKTECNALRHERSDLLLSFVQVVNSFYLENKW